MGKNLLWFLNGLVALIGLGFLIWFYGEWVYDNFLLVIGAGVAIWVFSKLDELESYKRKYEELKKKKRK